MVRKLLSLALLVIITAMIPRDNIQGSESREAVFAGGCFWCMEPPLEKLDGVLKVESGYTGGSEDDATYEEVSSGMTAHVEAVRVIYDPGLLSFSDILEVFWAQIDPTDEEGQFVDRGPQYASAIFYGNEEEREVAEASKQRLIDSCRFKEAVVTRILPLTAFYVAEEYHQDYHKKNPIRYKLYRATSGRDSFLDKHWNDKDNQMAQEECFARNSDKKGSPYSRPGDEDIRERLTALQFEVTQREGTEPPFKNEYWDNKEEGIYVDVVSGEPLFSSMDKFDSGTGWPSFTRPLKAEHITEHEDRRLFQKRTEVRSRHGDSHLGHLFPDGPEGTRYCINSAALRFVPLRRMEEEGYVKYLPLFNDSVGD